MVHLVLLRRPHDRVHVAEEDKVEASRLGPEHERFLGEVGRRRPDGGTGFMVTDMGFLDGKTGLLVGKMGFVVGKMGFVVRKMGFPWPT